MGSVALLQSLKDSIVGQAGVKTVFGEPIAAQGKTIIPIAKLIYGYGGGAGTGGVGNSGAQGEGGGGGAGVRAIPVGVIEVSDQQTRFIPITNRKRWLESPWRELFWASYWAGANGVENQINWRFHLPRRNSSIPVAATAAWAITIDTKTPVE